MKKANGVLFLILISGHFLFAADMPDTVPVPDASQNDTNGIDSTAVSHAEADSGKADSTVIDSLLAATLAKTANPKPAALRLPELEIVPSRFIEFFNHELAIEGNELVFDGSFIVLGKAVYGHFDFMRVGDSGTVLTILTTDNRSYRSDKGGRPKSLAMKIGPAAGCVLVKASFHEMRVEPENGLCVVK